ncbi:MAG: DUF6263 family protein [Ginsengibacter sp.]
MIKNTLFLSSSLLFSAAGVCQNAGKLMLNKGEKYIIENKISAVSTQEMMGQSMNSKVSFFTSNNMEVKEVKKDNYDLINTYTKLTASINAMGQDMSFDSDKKEDMDGEMGSGMKNLINQPKNVVMDKNGKIIPDTGDTTVKKPEAGMMSMMMNQVMGSPEETGYGLSEAFMIIPNALAGFSWIDSSSTDGVKKTTTYTVTNINGTEAVVSISGIINMDTKMEMQGTELATKSNGKLTGEEVVDLKTGVIKQRNTTMEGSGKVEVMGQEIPTTTRMTVIGTIKRL